MRLAFTRRVASTREHSTAVPREAAELAREANLRYVDSTRLKGITREPVSGQDVKFRYRGADGRLVRDARTLLRIRQLAIPPAWREVWICPDSRGHLQATGIDARGRKQYRYHAVWSQVRNAVKYDRMVDFARALPRMRARVDRDLRRPGLTRDKVLATVVALLEETRIRVGNDAYARENGSFGLTTLRDRHVKEHGKNGVRLQFTGKGGKVHDLTLADPRLARVVKRCREIPGQELFQYYDEETGERCAIDSGDVNDYIREIAGADFTAKDFRTWAGTVLAARALGGCGAPRSEREGQRRVVEAVKQVATSLRNTPAVCRKAYVHPGVIDAYLDGALDAERARQASTARRQKHGLAADERCVLALLQRLQAAEKRASQQAA